MNPSQNPLEEYFHKNRHNIINKWHHIFDAFRLFSNRSINRLKLKNFPSKQLSNEYSSGINEPRKSYLSIIVVAYNIPRELPRTLLSLSKDYQHHISAEEYEVLVVDNGSDPAISKSLIKSFGHNFRLIKMKTTHVSPAGAVNCGIQEARGNVIGVMIDGARIVTPGLLNYARHGALLYNSAVVATPGWYLGYDFQRFAIKAGYNRTMEDTLLAQINWPKDGYRLFEIGTPDESSVEAWTKPIAESNVLFMHKNMWQQLGGMDERFVNPGGGLLNLDTYKRAIELPEARLVMVLGEASFHQFHGGIATNQSIEISQKNWEKWAAEYKAIRGKPFSISTPAHPVAYTGRLHHRALSHFTRDIVAPISNKTAPPLGQHFDMKLWTNNPFPRSENAQAAALTELAQNLFYTKKNYSCMVLCRIIRQHFPDEPEPKRMLQYIARNFDAALEEDEEHWFMLAEAYRILGQRSQAVSYYKQALTMNPNFTRSHVALANLSMPGPNYLEWLKYFYTTLNPACIVEIGIYEGASLSLAPASAIAIGIDPTPRMLTAPKAETHLFAETSDTFFSRYGPGFILHNRIVDFSFIDGLHLFEQALKDFINLEKYSGPRSVILFHDTIPLDEPTQSRSANSDFYTGDVWKTILCLKYYRPDLKIFTIATPMTGLTVVTGLDATSTTLNKRFDEAVARFINTPYSTLEQSKEELLNIVPNDQKTVYQLLNKYGLLRDKSIHI